VLKWLKKAGLDYIVARQHVLRWHSLRILTASEAGNIGLAEKVLSKDKHSTATTPMCFTRFRRTLVSYLSCSGMATGSSRRRGKQHRMDARGIRTSSCAGASGSTWLTSLVVAMLDVVLSQLTYRLCPMNKNGSTFFAPESGRTSFLACNSLITRMLWNNTFVR